MSENYDHAQRLLDTLSELHRGTATDAQLTTLLRRNLVAFGSASDDNVNGAKHLKVRTTRSRDIAETKERQITLKNSNLPLTDVIDALDSLRLLPQLQQELPELQESEWQATLRFIMLILMATEHYIPIKRGGTRRGKSTTSKK